jgi:hypothetical protein
MPIKDEIIGNQQASRTQPTSFTIILLPFIFTAMIVVSCSIIIVKVVAS